MISPAGGGWWWHIDRVNMCVYSNPHKVNNSLSEEAIIIPMFNTRQPISFAFKQTALITMATMQQKMSRRVIPSTSINGK